MSNDNKSSPKQTLKRKLVISGSREGRKVVVENTEDEKTPRRRNDMALVPVQSAIKRKDNNNEITAQSGASGEKMSLERRLQIQSDYGKIDKARIDGDIMYMMLSCRDKEKKDDYLQALVRMLYNFYRSDVMVGGLEPGEITTLNKILESNDPLYQDAMWFFAFYTLKPIRDWLLVGIPPHPPPATADKEKLKKFMNSSELSEACEDLINARITLETYVTLLRSLYTFKVGFRDPFKN